jgi:hypothetical protein
LTPTEVAAALTLKTPDLIEEIHGLSLRLLQNEDQRESRADAKAQGLLITAGLSLTAASTFGGVLLQHPEFLTSAVGRTVTTISIVVYGLGLVAGLLASFFAVRALLVTGDFRAIDERVALAREVLKVADEQESPFGRGTYRRFMTAHQWRIWHANFNVLDRKSRRIRTGQIFFMIFLSVVLAFSGVMAFASGHRVYRAAPPPVSSGSTP